MFNNRLQQFLILIATLSLFPSFASAARPITATYSAKLNTSALQPGQTAVAAVVVDIKPGLHAQSHTPITGSGVNYIKFEVSPDPNPNIDFLAPIYPAPQTENFSILGPQSVYTGEVIVFIPLRVKTTAPPGDVTLSGKLTWQACNDHTCFPPSKNQPFQIATKIVPATETVAPANAEIFAAFDPRVFATAPQLAEASPAAPAAQSSSTTIDFFGRKFELASSNILLAMAIALVVGILFNLMPCVLPVVPLKIIGFVQASNQSRAKCFLLGCSFSAGVITFFGILAQLVVVTRAQQWGQIFSHGWFIWPVVVLLLILTAGMFGLFEIVLPDAVYSLSPKHDSIPGNFLFGIFTAVLSSPCVAPMFAGVLTWALAQPTWVGVSAFLMVGFGMALPYLILSAFPNLVKWIPRTGPGSLVLKQTMAFALLAVAVYFAGVRLATPRSIAFSVFAVIAFGMFFFVLRTAQLTRRLRPILASLVVAACVTAIALVITLRFLGGLDWQSYSDQTLATARATGKPVLVEFTANWCPNCLSIEATVFHDARTKAALNQYDVVLIRADLSDENAPGWPKVNELNPGGGIPLTAIYSPRGGDPDKLTSLYTSQNLIDAISRAATGS